ncbi:hypothetical protein M5K25_011549 [Dendrobium thyrsiflorum]|uniref:Uncharacterized protein n=1 Tax=Dendrobium thyrsiflorum TaxID=117978 RepID=A0ABD0V324_DENTH
MQREQHLNRIVESLGEEKHLTPPHTQQLPPLDLLVKLHLPPHDSSSHLANRQILSPASPPVDASLNSRADHASPSLDAPAARISHLFSSPGVVHEQLADTGLLSSRLRADDLLPSEAPPTLPVLSSICLKISCHAYWTRSDLTQGIYVISVQR